MTIKILFSANEENWKRYKAPLQDALDDKSLDYELGINIIPSEVDYICLLYTSPSPRDRISSRMPSSA